MIKIGTIIALCKKYFDIAAPNITPKRKTVITLE